jgi:glycosyltransferase involved in cell wall biosynthesis
MMEDHQPFVSVLTPVYNTEKYLAACIESVLSQTYANWEYVIVNNRSTDRSLQIAESYARLDPRIRIVTNPKHLKQMENLNRAFHFISGDSKYCKVIHADDWLFPECLSRMVAVAEAHPTVGIVGSYRLDERIVNLDELPYPSPCTDGKEIGRRYFQGGRYLFGSPSSLLIRSDLIRKRPLFYNESTLHGDKLACFDILREADFGFVHQVLTFTRRHNESATAFIKKYETYRLGTLQAMLLYGESFFTPAEYAKCLKSLYSAYYRFLAKKLIELRGLDFFRFHKKELRNLNHRLSYPRLSFAVIWELLNFRDAFKTIIRSVRKGNENNARNPNEVGARQGVHAG